ncbi:MAG: lipocalin family protein [Bacteroidota bacterium]
MNNLFKTLGLTLLLAFTLTACNTTTPSEFLVMSPWVYDSFENPDLDSDTRDLFVAVFSISTWTYSEDGTYTITYAQNAFDPNNGTWALDEDGTELTLEEDGDTDRFEVLTLDDDVLSLQFVDSTGTNILNLKH